MCALESDGVVGIGYKAKVYEADERRGGGRKDDLAYRTFRFSDYLHL